MPFHRNKKLTVRQLFIYCLNEIVKTWYAHWDEQSVAGVYSIFSKIVTMQVLTDNESGWHDSSLDLARSLMMSAILILVNYRGVNLLFRSLSDYGQCVHHRNFLMVGGPAMISV